MLKIIKDGFVVKARETSLAFKKVRTREGKEMILIKVTKPVYHQTDATWTYEDCSELFWVDPAEFDVAVHELVTLDLDVKAE
jgi:uncharacterized protein YegJ (DUF2314 family)